MRINFELLITIINCLEYMDGRYMLRTISEVTKEPNFNPAAILPHKHYIVKIPAALKIKMKPDGRAAGLA